LIQSIDLTQLVNELHQKINHFEEPKFDFLWFHS